MFVSKMNVTDSNRPSGLRYWLDRLRVYGRMIQFHHSVFALPFALTAVMLAHRVHPVTLGRLFWILAAMVAARSAAMGFNRIVDQGYDGQNPRTAGRALPAGLIARKDAALFVLLSAAAFVFSAGMLGFWCLVLAGPVLVVLGGYSYTKRFTSWAHAYLGLAIALAPPGAWLAVTGGLSAQVFLISLALWTYITGFDLLYACQDTLYDRDAGLYSVPARHGERTAFRLARLAHGLSFFFFFLVGGVFGLSWPYYTAWMIIGGLLIAEHRLVRPGDLRRIHVAFFHVNAAVSVVFFLGVLAGGPWR
jgi:4-hydroxybenzoate polyprenyltransferase